MIFLDADGDYLVAESRAEMVDALLEHLPDEPDDETLTALAVACLGLVEPGEVILVEA